MFGLACAPDKALVTKVRLSGPVFAIVFLSSLVRLTRNGSFPVMVGFAAKVDFPRPRSGLSESSPAL